jgi:hypothetical protein
MVRDFMTDNRGDGMKIVCFFHIDAYLSGDEPGRHILTRDGRRFGRVGKSGVPVLIDDHLAAFHGIVIGGNDNFNDLERQLQMAHQIKHKMGYCLFIEPVVQQLVSSS